MISPDTLRQIASRLNIGIIEMDDVQRLMDCARDWARCETIIADLVDDAIAVEKARMQQIVVPFQRPQR